ncbi:MAG: ATP-binding cassette domain-containing protein, partial [Gemmatimonadota bacterium]
MRSEVTPMVLTMPEAPPLLEVRDLCVRFDSFFALRGVGVSVKEGEIVVLLGANGAGKSTLFRAISGLHPPADGSIRFQGRDVTGLPAHRLVAQGIAVLVDDIRRRAG